MEDKVKKLEETLGAKYEDWTNETLAGVLNSEDALKLMTPELVVHLLMTRKNDKIVDVLVPVKYGFDIRAIKAKIEEQLVNLKEKKMPIEEYRAKILELKKLDNPIFKIAIFLTEIASFGDGYDVSKEEKEIRDAISGIKKVMVSLKIDEGFQILTEMLDILFPLRELYFQRYKVDLIKDDADIKRIVDSVNEKAKEVLEAISEINKQGQTESNGEKE
jgi:hypothetical protein